MAFNLRRFTMLTLTLVLCMGLVACDGSSKAKALTINTADMSIVSRQADRFLSAQERLPELGNLVNQRNWVFTRNLIHGPMQEVGREMLYINQHLLPQDRNEAGNLAESLKAALAELDEAAKLQDGERLDKAYSKVVSGFAKYLEVIPSEAIS
uniref:Photosystem II protein PsbQ n=1 Tax=Paulinella chromatophora TaxID=39717 RepID=B1X4G4_PAUCH|nr:hypothetical protein PCC_0393 [Paulinella chromatophora]ACB42833.1 hypothetical protein PCC_0393 [Paulinella chromatophora]|eukprot:gb/GEZN01008989.1/.p2 GENE.gb/GEZN01008989.1/~~gb/GEZN01008989.1/.p2  ORF type:complete len:153 (-),score=9.02 gb/GEZN01008989.1/:750-1208(-)